MNCAISPQLLSGKCVLYMQLSAIRARRISKHVSCLQCYTSTFKGKVFFAKVIKIAMK